MKRKLLLSRLLTAMVAMLLLVGCAGNVVGGESATTADDVTTTTVADVTTTTASEAATTTGTAAANTTTAKPVAATTTKSTRRTVSTVSKTKKEDNWDKYYPIEQTMTPQQAAAAVKHATGSTFTKIKKETAAVTTFNKEMAFAHHTGIAYFKGKLYGMFSQHPFGEDYPGQLLAIASSSDFYNWSEPQVVVEAWKGTIGDVAIIPCGIYTCDGKLFVNFMAHDFGGMYWDSNGNFQPAGDDSASASTTTWISFSEDGVNWSEPAKCGAYVGGRIRQLISGRWWNGMYYSDEEELDGFFWEKGGVTAEQIQRAKNRGATLYTERSWYENKDGVLFDMARTDTGVMWLSQSYDGGNTWTESYPTNFTSDNNQFPMIELPDGRIAAAGSPTEGGGGPWDMWPLDLYISEDGYNFDKAYTISDERYQLKQPGYSKGGSFGYPKLLVQDGYLYVCHSKMKEVIEIHRIEISDI